MARALDAWSAIKLGRQIAIVGALLGMVALIAIQIVDRSARPTNAVLLLFLLTLLLSQAFGFWAALCSAVVSDLILVFFFFDPIFVFWASDLQLRMTLGMFLVASAVAGVLLRDESPRLRINDTRPAAASRQAEPPVATSNKPALQYGALSIDATRRLVLLDGNEVSLTPTEFTLLQFLTSNAGAVLSHGNILASVWGEEYAADSQILRTYIKQLRAKLGDDPAKPRFIRTEARIGYRFIPTT